MADGGLFRPSYVFIINVHKIANKLTIRISYMSRLTFQFRHVTVEDGESSVIGNSAYLGSSKISPGLK